MKNTIKETLITLLLLIAAGCSTEYLDPVPKTSLNEQFIFDTKERIVAQVNGMYSSLKNGAFLGGRFFVYNDVRCEYFIPKSSNLVTNYATWNHSVVASTNEVQNLWGAIYASINQINIFLEGINKAWNDKKIEGMVTQTEYNQYLS